MVTFFHLSSFQRCDYYAEVSVCDCHACKLLLPMYVPLNNL